MPLASDNTISLIVNELKKLGSLEQKEFLAQLRAKRLLRRKHKPMVSLSRSVKPLTMTEIDRIKHLSRKTV